MITYCGSLSSIRARSSAARIAIAPSSVARYDASPPPSLPNGVRTALTITDRMSAKVALLPRQPSGEGHDQPDRPLDVVQRAQLTGRVHVAERDRDEARRDAAARAVELVCVGV